MRKTFFLTAFPPSLERWLLKSSNESPGTIQLYFHIKTEQYSFLITAEYFGKHFEVVIQKESAVIAPFCTVTAVYFEVVKTIQDHIDALIEAENAIKAINDNQDGKWYNHTTQNDS